MKNSITSSIFFQFFQYFSKLILMFSPASYISSAYSFIYSSSDEQLLKAGNSDVEGNQIPIPSFDEDLLINLCNDAKQIFKKEENVINIDGNVIVVGDIHGSLHDLFRILKYIENSGSKAVSLGDYVDRGNFSLECITLLFSMKILKPKSYYLIRGNHEFEEMCSRYGFKWEILNYYDPNKCFKEEIDQQKTKSEDEDKCNEEREENCTKKTYFADHININCYKYTEKLYDAFMKAFSYIPISAIINKTLICLHGGLTPLLNRIEEIKTQIKRPVTTFNENLILSDIVWGDPTRNMSHLYDESQRGRGKVFGGSAIVNFLNSNNLKRLIRGHQCVEEGIEELFNYKCITVFSASSYSNEMENSSGILKIYQQNDQTVFLNFPPINRLSKCDTVYYKVQPFNQKNTNQAKFSICNQKGVGERAHSFNHIIPSYLEKFGYRHKTSSTRNANTHALKIPQLNSKPQKRFSCIIHRPLILTPNLTKN